MADRLHLVRGANTALDAFRRERQHQVGRRRPKGVRRSGHLATWAPELCRARRLLAKGAERLSERERARLCELLAADPVIGAAWALKEAFPGDLPRAGPRRPRRALDRFLGADRAVLPAFSSSAEGVRGWHQELLSSFAEPTTNGDAEGDQQGQGDQAPRRGLPSFESFRRRVLVACG